MEGLPQDVVLGEARVLERLIEARDRTAVHLIVLAVAAVEPDDGRLVAVRG